MTIHIIFDKDYNVAALCSNRKKVFPNDSVLANAIRLENAICKSSDHDYKIGQTLPDGSLKSFRIPREHVLMITEEEDV